MAGIVRSKLEKLEYALDYDGDHTAATWTEIPIKKVRQSNASHPNEEAAEDNNINGVPDSAGVNNSFAYPLAYADEDTFLEALIEAQNGLDRVHFRLTPVGQTPRIVGGPTGCSVMVAQSPIPDNESLANAMISGACSANLSGDTWEIQGAS